MAVSNKKCTMFIYIYDKCTIFICIYSIFIIIGLAAKRPVFGSVGPIQSNPVHKKKKNLS